MSANNDTLNIITWNAQSIANQSKRAELGLLLRQHGIHIACIQETYLNQSSKIFIDGYVIHRNDRDSHGGGVAIIVRSDIEEFRFCLVPDFVLRAAVVQPEPVSFV